MGGFWQQWQHINHHKSLQHAYNMLEQAGNFSNFRIAAGWAQGSYQGRNFLDSDVYKWLEAVAYDRVVYPAADVHQQADQVIDVIAAAQQPDGYLNTYYQLVEPQHRWTDLDHGHELYCAGHLFQAAVAYKRAVDDDRLLQIATRFADHIDRVFGAGKRSGAPGHPEIEMALVELYRVTSERRYLALAQFFLDERGKGRMRGLGWVGSEYHQDRVPIREATEIEGHAVRALYLLAGVADVYLETGETALLNAANRLWQDMTSGKLHVTGGVGARYEGESFGKPYELPNDQCYCETCAAIADVMWNWRMLLATGEGRFFDIIEQTLYNSFLSGAGADGEHYFYMNPLLAHGDYERRTWYEVACCPPNIMRTLASVGHYLATTDDNGMQIHMVQPATITVPLPSGGTTELTIATDYPWQGQAAITVHAADHTEWTLSIRVPGWCEAVSVQVNDEHHITQPGDYIHIRRVWAAADIVSVDFHMEAQLLEAHPFIDPTRYSLVIRRGPVVYCLEQKDQDVDLMAVTVDEAGTIEDRWDAALMGGSMVLHIPGYKADTRQWANQLYRPLIASGSMKHQPITLKAIPYFQWGNRGADAMRVWIPRQKR